MSEYMRLTADGNYAVRLRKDDGHELTMPESVLAEQAHGSENGKLKYIFFSNNIIDSFGNSREICNILRENGYVYIYRVKPVEGDIAFRLNGNGEPESSSNFYCFHNGDYQPHADSKKSKENQLLTTVPLPPKASP